ncbi:hypothetical protein [Burkholderia gladioli]|uniref:hypothetical protein n=1 Tax=Burkholderia gladioli TaxID=28095 RepID=UPI00163FE5C8|nr:hypothetical protein [Burkholderia gladioli]
MIIVDDMDVWSAVAREIFLADFSPWEDALQGILAAGSNQRALDRACIAFFEDKQPVWQRYDEYLAYWSEPDPRTPEFDDEGIVSDGSFREAGELLAHRISLAYYMYQRRRRYLENVENRPYFRLVAVGDGRTYEDCLEEQKTIHRFDSAYWRSKQLPCRRLFCRCRIQALTEKEVASRNI